MRVTASSDSVYDWVFGCSGGKREMGLLPLLWLDTCFPLCVRKITLCSPSVSKSEHTAPTNTSADSKPVLEDTIKGEKYLL